MNKLKTKITSMMVLVSALSAGWMTGCSDDNAVDGAVMLDNEVNQFIWQGLNLYYFWQEQVPDLADTRFNTTDQLTTYLNQFPQPEVLFESLQFQDDRFSWIVDDYVELDNSFQGISKSFGYEFRIARKTEGGSEVFGFVEYVVPNSPASTAQLARGDIFTNVDGVDLTIDNYRSLLLESENYTLALADFVENEFVLNGTTVSLTAIELTENPILMSETLDVNGTKVGYLVYNQFINSNEFHRQLNEVFGTFSADGITELVLDLRYNPGGSLLTTRLLASMIYGAADEGAVFGKIIYNTKLADLNADFNFFESVPIFDNEDALAGEEPMSRLNINRVFILTSGSTASASELIIAGLLPYMDVTLIGTTTVGKNVGSVTLYDSPDQGFLSNEPGEINPNHTYAMQPIISQLSNSELFSDYINGFDPMVEVNELDFFSDLQPLGSEEEPLLREALAMITGSARLGRKTFVEGFEHVMDSRAGKHHLQTILLEPEDVKQLLRFY